MYAKIDLEPAGTLRRPYQCKGIERGPKRMAEVAAGGSVNGQITSWSSILQPTVPTFVPIFAGL